MTPLRALDAPAKAFFWTAPGADGSELLAESPLALDYITQQVGLLLLPALTTRSARAQSFATVLYGLRLADLATQRYGTPATDDQRRLHFERWERFWALGTLEHRGGVLARSDRDNMRGVRGAKAAWRAGDGALPLDYPLISRQQELGSLGAYLVPLRRAGLVLDGSLRPSPAALDIIDAYWDEPPKDPARYEAYALLALDPERTRIERKHAGRTLARVGEKSRLTALHQRAEQQQRLHRSLFERLRGHTPVVARLVEAAAREGLTHPRELLDAAMAGRFGALDPELGELLLTTRALGDVVQALTTAFDRVYDHLVGGRWIDAAHRTAEQALADRAALQAAAARYLDAPCADRVRALPNHGRAFHRLVERVRDASAAQTLAAILDHHDAVQRARQRGSGWIRREGDTLTLQLTHYTARPAGAAYPSFKLDIVRSLLVDTGRLPLAADAEEDAA